jgi:hypothetical protein
MRSADGSLSSGLVVGALYDGMQMYGVCREESIRQNTDKKSVGNRGSMRHYPKRRGSGRERPVAFPRCQENGGSYTMSDDELKAELERLRTENAALKRGASSGIRMKVSEKGAVSVYGMGRFPITLYKEQWLKLLDMAAEIRAFIAANESQLKAKE